MAKVLVPGGYGFLGRRVVEKLKNLGYEVIAVSRTTDLRKWNEALDIFNLTRPDYVINCAAFFGGIQFGIDKSGEIFFNNITISTNVMECARALDIKRIVTPMANCTYPGHLTDLFREEQWWDGALHESVLSYGFVSKARWVQSWAYYRQYGLEGISLIMPNMYGEGDHLDDYRSHALGALIARFVKAKRNNEREVVVWGTGKPVREWLYAGDGAEALVRALAIPMTEEPINVGTGVGVSVRDLAGLIANAVDYEGWVEFDASKPDGAMYKALDCTRMKEIFNWEPEIDLEKGIKRTVNWYLKEM